ncbi:lef-1 [Cyclophragma undans nucleopolyhedrovirus]|uniref:Lef-1 n=1 Tax=Cyclophragma undans nucleopolyhedrovirus TaxID=1906244 RepID=A0A288QAD9_9ABAC|nr:lef-1 [Cyclophragma undans nucleopolyhedrovirus]AOT85595.1 lef-1 [Cyclophragma undans nucleopolyhedrovirus]
MAAAIYTVERVNMMWSAIAYNDSRKFAFHTIDARWVHPNRYFETAADLYKYIIVNKISDVHVKPLDGGGREWVIDADFKNCANEAELTLKINIGATAFLLFYGIDNVSRVMFSGNRGFHVWLKFAGKFKMSSASNVRMHRCKAFDKPTKLIHPLRPGSFAYAVQQAVRVYFISDSINIKNNINELTLLYWPDVDKDIFCNSNKQIRAPFSYNYKGKRFSRCITKDLVDRIKQCFPGFGSCGEAAAIAPPMTTTTTTTTTTTKIISIINNVTM